MAPRSRRSAEVDAYVARAPEFARPVLERIRAAFHAGCPELEERIKWGSPSFEHRGILGGMAAFQRHVAFGFWKSRLMEGFAKTFSREPRASAMGARVTSVKDLPPKAILVAFVKEAARLNEQGAKEPVRARPRRAARVVVPADLREALANDARARATFESFPPSQRREYVEWIREAKRAETRRRRLATALAWLAQGKSRNWKHERPRGTR